MATVSTTDLRDMLSKLNKIVETVEYLGGKILDLIPLPAAQITGPDFVQVGPNIEENSYTVTVDSTDGLTATFDDAPCPLSGTFNINNVPYAEGTKTHWFVVENEIGTYTASLTVRILKKPTPPPDPIPQQELWFDHDPEVAHPGEEVLFTATWRPVTTA